MERELQEARGTSVIATESRFRRCSLSGGGFARANEGTHKLAVHRCRDLVGVRANACQQALRVSGRVNARRLDCDVDEARLRQLRFVLEISNRPA